MVEHHFVTYQTDLNMFIDNDDNRTQTAFLALKKGHWTSKIKQFIVDTFAELLIEYIQT